MNPPHPRIAIPEPTCTQPEYNERSWPQYAEAVQQAGGIPVRIPLHATPTEVARLASSCQGILLPGSPADLNPQKYGQQRIKECAEPDPAREAVDELLLQEAFNLHKPLLGICYGAQSLNVWKGGTLVQHLATPIQHKAGRDVIEAHSIELTSHAQHLAALPGRTSVNSSHHQAIARPGDGLQVIARAEDRTVEAVEQPGPHFVLAVQWHPERTLAEKAESRAIFAAFLDAVRAWKPREIRESVAR